MAKVMHAQKGSKLQKEVDDIFEGNLQESILKKYQHLILLTRKETAELLCISLPTLHDWTKSGILKGYRIGNRVLYKMHEVTGALELIQTTSKRGGSGC